MKRKLAVDRSIYLVDEDNRTYRFLERNPGWESIPREENECNKAALDGYTRVLRNRTSRIFRYHRRP